MYVGLGLGAARGLWGSGLSGFRAAGPRVYKDYGKIQNSGSKL